jgi:A/G-specific adenine glycosylase
MQYFCTTVKENYHSSFFHDQLVYWHQHHNGRQMPWKEEKDPYRIWLSEIILQQTRVDQGLAYYERFIEKYPTIVSLANAVDTDVFKLWEGLGYYSRCKNLLFTARLILTDFKGVFPNSYADILKLKGVGPYTAAAISSFAYNLPYAVVDGNVTRVLARYFGIDTPIDSTAGKQVFSEKAQQLVNKEEPGKYNQAIMDFGATICKPQLPLCDECFLQSNCSAFLTNTVSLLPVKSKKLTRRNRLFCYVIVQFGNGVYIRKRMAKDIWQNLHEFVLLESEGPVPPPEIWEHPELNFLKGAKFVQLSCSPVAKQVLTHQLISGFFIHVRVDEPLYIPGFAWVDLGELSRYAFPRFINSFLQDYPL